MFVKYLKDCPEFKAGDDSILREFLHPDKADLQIQYSLAYAKVLPGQTTKKHKLKTSEVYFIIEGNGIMHINEESAQVTSNCAVYIPPNSIQYLENTTDSDLKFVCIVEPAWQSEDEEVLNN